MFTFSIEDLKSLQEVYDDATGRGYEYDIPRMVIDKVSNSDCTVEDATKDAIQTYLGLSGPEILSNSEYSELGVDDVIFNRPLSDMPLFVNNTSSKKRVAALWRMKIGK